MQIMRHIEENFINRVDMDVLGSDIPRIDIVDLGADLHIVGHLGRGNYIAYGYFWMGLKVGIVSGFPDQLVAGGRPGTLFIHSLDARNDFKQPSATGDPV